jgi:ornithine carbamoyltransferase
MSAPVGSGQKQTVEDSEHPVTQAKQKRDFLRLADLSPEEHRALFARARSLKAARDTGQLVGTLAGRTLLLLMEKNSTRTRVSFEAAMQQLGGGSITLPMQDSQLSRGEPLEDTGAVVSRYVDAIVFRTFGDERLERLARVARVPVINGLSEGGHPVQLLADLLTVVQRLGPAPEGGTFPDALAVLRGKVVAWIGDAASNMAFSWIEAARLFGFSLRIAAPAGYRPPPALVAEAGDRVRLCGADEAATSADVITTDVWISMGQEAEKAARAAAFTGYCVDERLMARAAPHAVFLHCLPAHRGEEVTAGVIDGPQSAVLDEAENRMHVQKALLELLVLGRLG